MKSAIASLLAMIILTACGDGKNSGQAKTEAGSDIFDMPYLMRDLDNGLRVIIVETDYPDIVSLQIPVQTGSRNEVEPGKSGFAHFFEHMMFRGTSKFPAEEYLNILKNAGASQNAYTTDDYTNYYIRFTKSDLEKILELEADRFMNLEYSEDVFRTEALAVKGEYLKNYSNPTSKAFERLRAMAFDKHTYGHTTMGFIEDIEQMPEQFDYSRTFFDRWYRPEKAAVIIVGDVDAEATFGLVEKYFGEWQQGSFEAEIPVEPPLAGPLYEHIRWDAPTQPWLLTGFRGPAFDPEKIDMPAIDVLASIYFSNSSDLYRKLVLEDQSVDQLLVSFPNRKDPNILLIYARLTDAGHAATVDQAIRDTLAKARSELVSASSLQETKSRLKYGFASTLDNSSAIGSMLAGFVHFDRTPETVNALYRSYDNLTSEDLRDVANRYFADAGRITVSLSNDEALAGLDGLASIDELVVAEFPDTDAGTEPAANMQPEEIAAEPSFTSIPGEAPAVPVDIVAHHLPGSALVDVSFIVHSGAAMDPVGKKGLAALTAAMIADGGSAALEIQQINRAMYPIAASFNAQVDKEMTRFAGQVHRDNLDLWYELASGQLLTPAWRETDFMRVKQQLVNAVRTSLVGNNDEELGKEVLYREIFGPQHPYGSLSAGHSDDIRALTIDDVRRFYKRHYTLRNMTVGVAGGYPESLPARIAADLQQLDEGEREQLSLPQPPAIEANRAVIVKKDTPAVAVSFGYPIDLRRGDRDWVALWLVRSWLGEHRNSSGQLYGRIRETRGMNYGNYAYIEYFPRGMFQLQPDTNIARQQQIFQVWLRPLRSNNDAHFATRVAIYEIAKLIEKGMDEEEFERSRNFLSKYVSLQTDGQSRGLGYAIDSRYYEIDEFADYVRRELSRMTLADVNRVIREQLRTDNVQYVFVSKDAEGLKTRLASEASSPLSYDAEQPESVLNEDRVIESLPLLLDADAIEIVDSADVFR